MVLRERRINYQSNDVKLSLSFGVADVKALMKMYAEMFDDDLLFAKDNPNSESDIRYWLEHDGRAFLSWPDKWRKELSGWCFATALRNGFLEPTAADKNRYFLSDCLFAKRGRPRKKD